jgi:hypothetical protein
VKRGSTKIATLPVGLRGQIVSLRKAGMNCADICSRLQLDKQSERNAVSQICAEPGLRAYGHGTDVRGPVKPGRNPAAVIRP